MTEIELRNSETLIIDVDFNEMIELIADAKRKSLMVNVFDNKYKRRFAFFPETVAYVSEIKKEIS